MKNNRYPQLYSCLKYLNPDTIPSSLLNESSARGTIVSTLYHLHTAEVFMCIFLSRYPAIQITGHNLKWIT